MAERRWHLSEAICLLLVAGLYFAWGCGLGLDLSDEGQIVFASWRTAKGGVPYRDFFHIYGPSLLFLNGALFRWIAEDLVVIRVSLVILKSLTAVLVYLCARRVASRASSLFAYILVLAIWGMPLVFNTPYANHYAMTLLLGGIAVFMALRRRFSLACFLAGLCFGLAATFKQTTGAFSVLSFMLFLLMEPSSSQAGSSARSTPAILFVARLVRWAVLFAALGAILAYQSTGTTPWNVLVVSGPLLITVAFLAAREFRGGPPPDQCVRSVYGIVLCGVGASLPVLVYVAVYASLGRLTDLAFSTVGLAAKAKWFVPFPLPTWRTLVCASAIVTMLLAARLWRATPGSGKRRRWIAAGSTGLFLISLCLVWNGFPMPRSGAWAFFRNGFWYGDVYRVIFFLPLGILLVALPTIFREANDRSRDAEETQGANARRLLFLAAVAILLSLHPAADVLHVFMVLPIFLPLLSWELDRFHQIPGSNGTAGRFVSASAAVLFGVILAAPFVHSSVRAWVKRPPAELRMKRATGIAPLTPRLAEQVELVSYLETKRNDHGLLVLTNEQLLYFLSGQAPVMEKHEFILYLVGAGLIPGQEARALVPEPQFVERLRSAKPIIVDAVNNRMSMRIREVFPHVAQFVDENYRLERAIGDYRVLEDRTTE
jgi:hypothetical protein